MLRKNKWIVLFVLFLLAGCVKQETINIGAKYSTQVEPKSEVDTKLIEIARVKNNYRLTNDIVSYSLIDTKLFPITICGKSIDEGKQAIALLYDNSSYTNKNNECKLTYTTKGIDITLIGKYDYDHKLLSVGYYENNKLKIEGEFLETTIGNRLRYTIIDTGYKYYDLYIDADDYIFTVNSMDTYINMVEDIGTSDYIYINSKENTLIIDGKEGLLNE